MARNPNSTAIEKEYVFEIHGELIVTDYSEEQAEEQLKEMFPDLIRQGLRDNTIEIR